MSKSTNKHQMPRTSVKCISSTAFLYALYSLTGSKTEEQAEAWASMRRGNLTKKKISRSFCSQGFHQVKGLQVCSSVLMLVFYLKRGSELIDRHFLFMSQLC